MPYETEDIIAAKATPAGKSAIAVVRMTGEGALNVLRRCLPNFQGEIKARRAFLADIGEDEEIIDRVIIIYYRAPKSYTGDDLVEIHCHGGDYVSEKVLILLHNKGARAAEPGEFTYRAFMNGKMDLTEAEAVSDLVEAESDIARRSALFQLRGGLHRRITEMREILLEMMAELEVELEFPEDEPVEADYWGWGQRVKQALKAVDKMISEGEAAQHFRGGFRVVIAGPPNSGKSTLMNALMGEDRAIVHPQPGTTRDLLRESLELGGTKISLTDTAGLRSDPEEVEEEGIRRARSAVETADLTIYLFDLGVGYDGGAEGFSEKRRLIVGNKVDLHNPAGEKCDLKISALRGEGLEKLKAMIVEAALPQGVENYAVANQRHIEALRKSREYLRQALTLTETEGETELLALELRDAARFLGEVIGEGVTEEVLERIFNRFCIGK